MERIVHKSHCIFWLRLILQAQATLIDRIFGEVCQMRESINKKQLTVLQTDHYGMTLALQA